MHRVGKMKFHWQNFIVRGTILKKVKKENLKCNAFVIDKNSLKQLNNGLIGIDNDKNNDKNRPMKNTLEIIFRKKRQLIVGKKK